MPPFVSDRTGTLLFTSRFFTPPPRGRVVLFATLLLHLVFLPSCVFYRPRPLDEVPFLERAVTQEQGRVRVTASALGREESKKLFGVPLANEGIQPLWLDIDNQDDRAYTFFQQSVDPKYFSPNEAAYINHYSATRRIFRFIGSGLLGKPLLILLPIFPVSGPVLLASGAILLISAPFQYGSAYFANQEMDTVFEERGIGNQRLDPGERASGFVFTHLDEGTKQVNLRLFSPGAQKKFTMFVPVPGVHVDYEKLDEEKLYAPEEIQDLDQQGLYEALAALPCCTTNKKDTGSGDPLNLIVVGEFDQLLEVFTRAGWDETERLNVTSGFRTLRAFVFGSEYRYSPVSNLYLYDRAQDVAFQKARQTIHERNHLRLWLSPMRFEGQSVWVGQVSRDIGSRFTLKTWWLSTHKIDPDIDDARENVMGDLLETQRLALMGYVPGVGEAPSNKPRKNLTGDPYYTDGYRAVAMLADEPVEVALFDWDEHLVTTKTLSSD